MKNAIIITASLLLAQSVNAEGIQDIDDKMQTALSSQVNAKIEQQIDDAYFEYDRSWIIEEVVVVGKRDSIETYATSSDSLNNAGKDYTWSWSVSQ
jgi:hypothetical protein